MKINRESIVNRAKKIKKLTFCPYDMSFLAWWFILILKINVWYMYIVSLTSLSKVK